jgi:hypothetical protein
MPVVQDNFEWAQGYAMRFGLYECAFNLEDTSIAPKLPHKLRAGSQALVAAIAAHNRKHQIVLPPTVGCDSKSD